MTAARQLGWRLGVLGTAWGLNGCGSADIPTPPEPEEPELAALTWQPGPGLPTPRERVGLGMIDGDLYVVGGVLQLTTGSVGEPFDVRTEVFRLRGGTTVWDSLSPIPVEVHSFATVVIGHRLYLVGGSRISAPVPEMWIYDAVADKWTAGPELPETRVRHSATVLDGRIVVIGGFRNTDEANHGIAPATLFYDPATEAWSVGAPLPDQPRLQPFVTPSEGAGRVLVFGGGRTDVLDFDPVTGTSTVYTSLPIETHAGPIVEAAGWVHLVFEDIERHHAWNRAERRWQRFSPGWRDRRNDAAPIAIGDTVYLVGGWKTEDLLTRATVDVFVRGAVP